MKRNVRKICVVLLALVMSLVGGTVLTAQAQGETITVFMHVPAGEWEEAWVYWWGSAETVEWPGIPMSEGMCYVEGGIDYDAEIPADVTGVVFNDGGNNQSPDLYSPCDYDFYRLGASNWSRLTCDHEYVDRVCIHCGEVFVPAEDITVYFDLDIIQWDQVYIYGWSDDWYDALGTWPGMRMTHEGGSVYSARVSGDIENLIFTNGDGDQTDDLELPGDGYIYRKSEAAWSLHNGCSHEWDDGQQILEPTCTEYGRSQYGCRNCEVEMSVEFYPYGHDWVDDICDRCGQDRNEKYTVYLDMAFSTFTYTHFYWWSVDETIGDWPGEALTYEGGSIYSAQIPVYAAGLLFTDGQWQTGDLEIPGDGYVYRDNPKEWVLHNGCCHEWDGSACKLCGEQGTEARCNIYFDNTFLQYEDVYAECYCYTDGEYYSVKMTHLQGNIYTAQLPENATMWFSNGKISTLLADVLDGYLFVKDGAWIPYNGCAHEWDDGEKEDGFTCTEGGICRYTCDYCGQSFEENRDPMPHTVVDGVCIECGQGGTVSNLSYEISNGQVTITDCKDTVNGKLVIPDTIAGYPVTAIGNAAFFGVSLTEVVIPDSVITIGEQAFMYCDRMARITLSNHLKVIGNSSFEGCTSLVKITIPNSVTDIGEQAFIGCVKLSEVTIPEGVTSIGKCAFGVCRNLTEVTIPASVTNIGAYPFFDCLNLARIQVAKENAYYCNDAYGVLLNKNKTKLIQAPPAGLHGSYAMADSVKTIAKRAFYGCTDVTELILPNGLTTIEDSGCYYMGLTKVIIPATVTTMDESAFGYCLSLQNIYFCGDAPVFDDNVFMWAHANVYYHQGTKGWPAQINDWYDTQLVWKEAHIYAENGSCMVCGEGDSTTGLVKLEDGCWWYVINGKVATDTTTLVKWGGEWWYVVNGKVASDMTTLVKYNNEWWYVVKGKIASNTTSLVKYNNEWWYVVKGKIASKTTTLVKYNNEWWYVVNGKIASKTTTLVKYNNEWWYVVKGKIASKTTTLVQYNGGWYYLVKGKLAAKTTTLVQYNGGWYYVNKGSVDWSYTGNFTYNGGTYRIVKGRVA